MKAILCSWDENNGYLVANVIINTPKGLVYQYIQTLLVEDDMLSTLLKALQSLKNQDNIPVNNVYNAQELAWYEKSKYVYPCVLN